MKKQFLLLAGSAILFASCGNDNKAAEDAAANQRKIDSTAQAASAAKEVEMKAANDATIAAAAKAKADSEAIAKDAVANDRAKHPASNGGTKTVVTKTKTKTVEEVPVKQGGLRGHADNATPAPATDAKKSGGGLRGHADQNK